MLEESCFFLIFFIQGSLRLEWSRFSSGFFRDKLFQKAGRKGEVLAALPTFAKFEVLSTFCDGNPVKKRNSESMGQFGLSLHSSHWTSFFFSSWQTFLGLLCRFFFFLRLCRWLNICDTVLYTKPRLKAFVTNNQSKCICQSDTDRHETILPGVGGYSPGKVTHRQEFCMASLRSVWLPFCF